jgi:NUMOD3 motif
MTKLTKTNHYTYIIRHINGKYYVGRRSTKKDPLLDPYMGSGKWVKSIKDRSTLSKDIIAYYNSTEELKVAEMELIDKYFLDEYCMNMLYGSEGGNCGNYKSGDKNHMYGRFGDKHHMYGKRGELSPNYGTNHTEETKQKISDANSGDKHPQYGKTGELSHNYGKTHTEEHRRKNSDAKSGDKNYNFGKTGELSPRFGSTHSEESKILMSYPGEKHPNSSITDHIARMIKIRISEGVKNKPIEEEFNTTHGVVAGIRSGRTWKHIIIHT